MAFHDYAFVSDCVSTRMWMFVLWTHNAVNSMQFWHHTLKFHPYCVAVFLSTLIVSYQSESETELSKKQIQTWQGPARSHAGVISMGLYFPPFMGLFLPLWHINEILRSTEKAISIATVILHLSHSLSFGKLNDEWPKKGEMGRSSARKYANGYLTCFLFIVMEIVVPRW